MKPDKNKLTLFYLIIAVGGVVGSIFTSIIAERVFMQYYEFPVGIMLVYVLFAFTLWKENRNKTLAKRVEKQNGYLCFLSIAGLLAFSLYFIKLNNLYFNNDVYNSRNFYGTLTVKDFKEVEQPVRMLFDGATSHGTQYLSSYSSSIPTSYYRFDTGVSLALQYADVNKTKLVGIIGLGTGTLATYGNSGDNYVFYELNPDVAAAADNYFSYLSDSQAEVSVRLGDARITLQKELEHSGSQQYQVLIVDAFSSDYIPVHLLTLEAFQLYWKHLTQNGLLVLHISNNHLDLLPLVTTLAEKLDKKMLHFISAAENEHTAEWVIITNNTEFLNNAAVQRRATYLDPHKLKKILWTDEYSNLLSVIKF